MPRLSTVELAERAAVAVGELLERGLGLGRRAEYAVAWIAFALVSLLPLLAALVMLVVARERTLRAFAAAPRWLERHARTIAAVVLVAVAAALLRNGIVGLSDP
jgi:hypothetical protein